MEEKSESTKPNYISIYPCGEDLLEGKSHEKIAQSLLQLIQEKAIPNNVVGLEGEWGSGKSNVIEILADKFQEAKSDYVFYKYDTWAHQEDLTRRSFLDGLISFLKGDEKLGSKFDWNRLHKKLLAKISVTSVEKNPKVRLFYILFLAVIFTYNVLRVLFDDFLGPWDIVPNFSAPKWKEFLVVYLTPLILLIWGVCDLRREYKAFSKNDETKHFGFRERLKRLLYVFSGTDLESEELIERVEDEPSIQKFKKYFAHIQEDLKAEGLILVFDNMDRLYSPEKVLSIWSSIHTFFAEEDLKNVWVLVPYDREHLAKYFKENNGSDKMEKLDNFIGKTFTANFMIAPPILSDWKKFFQLKFKEAFKSNANENQIETVSSLYEILAPMAKKKPRDIINFINELVTLALQHEMEIELSYMALFLLRKDVILEQPLPAITSKSFLKQEAYLFQNEKELEQNLAALVYNIEKGRSGEILLKNAIEGALRKHSEEAWDDIKEHSEFKLYFNRAMIGSNLANYKPEIIAKSLDYLKAKLNPRRVKVYWEQFAKATEVFEKEYFLKLEDWHYKLFSNASPQLAKKVAKRAMDFAEKKITEDSGSMDYYTNVYNIIEYVNKNKLKFKPNPIKVKFNPEQMLGYIDDYHNHFDENCSFEEMNIYASSPEISKHLIDHPEGMVEEAYGYKHVIEFLFNLNTVYSFNSLRKKLEENIKNVSGGSPDEMEKLIELNKILCAKNKTIPLIPENNITPYIDTIKSNNEHLYREAIANQIAHLKTTSARSNTFENELSEEDMTKELAPTIQYYLSYGDLMKIVIDRGEEHNLLYGLVRDLTQNSYGRTQRADVGWMLSNLDKIKSTFYNEDLEVFLEELDRWEKGFENAIKTEDILERINSNILDIILEHHEGGFKCIQLLIDTACKRFEGMSREEWLELFKEEGQPHNILTKFFERSWIANKITKATEFMGAYEDHMEAIARKNNAIPNRNFWDSLLKQGSLDERKMSKIFNDVLDILLVQDPPDTAAIAFFGEGLFSRSSDRKTKGKDFVRKILLAHENDLEGFEVLLDRFEEGIIEVISQHSGEYNPSLSEMVTNLKLERESSLEKVERLFSKTELEELKIEPPETDEGSDEEG